MARVIIVSNRLPLSVKKVDGKLEFYSSIGGLATGLSSYVNSRNNRWIGWPGIPSDDLTDKEKHIITRELAKHHYAPVFLTKKQIDDFYNGYSNSILWPLFHNLPYKDKDEAQHKRWWKAYKSVNKAFAEATLELTQPGSRIWVHDYQLMLLPRMLRAERSEASIGFFLHIPFPSVRSYGKLAEADQLVLGVAGADLVGFHTADYAKNYLDNAQNLQLGVAGTDQLLIGARNIRVTHFPMGIDYERFARAKKVPAVRAEAKAFKRKYRGRKIIAAVDRLDISKGFIERLNAYQEFLVQNSKIHGKVVLVMVGAPSRTEIEAYKRLHDRVVNLSKEINQRFGTPNWQPIDYIDRAFSFEEVTALYQVADIAFIAPLRDGMNLMAKEFIASNNNKGVLILSETAGAAKELQDALLVNHRNPATLVAALNQAVTMRPREIRGRLKRMQKQLATNTVQVWAGNFMYSLQQPVPGTPRLTRALSETREKHLIATYRVAHKRLLLLDYDGTIMPLAENFTRADPPKSLLALLKKLGSDEQNEVVLISGRSQENLQTWFGDLPINLVAEHGALVKSRGGKTWYTTSGAGKRWKKTVKPLLEQYAELTPRAKVEEKEYSLVWHYRQAPAYYAQKYAVVLQRVLKPVIKPYGLQVFSGNKILEIKDPRVNKGEAIVRWLKHPHDFVLAIGDDYTDEDMFTTLPIGTYSIKVGRGRTRANYRLSNVPAVLHFLEQLAK